MGLAISQIFPPAPALTEANLPSQKGKVFVVTGGYSGVGQALAGILYDAGGSVYIAGRSHEKAKTAIDQIRSSMTTEHHGDGKLEFLYLDLSDLATVKPAVEALQAKEARLDVLFNNAAVNLTPVETKSAQGHELIMATNCLGPLLFTLCLLPLLQKTAQTVLPGSVRVIWSSSQVVDFSSTHGLPMTEVGNPPASWSTRYMNTKTGNWFLASEFARRYGEESRILSLSQNPGALKTNILRSAPWLAWLVNPLLYPAIYGAYTNLYAGLSTDLNLEEHSGGYVLPWGRMHPSPRLDLLNAMKSKVEGGAGRAEEFFNWCNGKTADFR